MGVSFNIPDGRSIFDVPPVLVAPELGHFVNSAFHTWIDAGVRGKFSCVESTVLRTNSVSRAE